MPISTLTFWMENYDDLALTAVLSYATANGLRLTDARAKQEDEGDEPRLWLTFQGNVEALYRTQDFVKTLGVDVEE
jgi:hypothetical protein